MNNILINRQLANAIQHTFDILPVITLTGPRQSGKTTLCRKMFPSLPYVNLEDISILNEVRSDTKSFLARYPGGVIIDEAQNYPEIFSYLQVAIDEDRYQGRNDRHFIVTGSNNFSLMERITQSMTGRTAVATLLPLSTTEIMTYMPSASTSQMILNGGYPEIWTTVETGRELLMSNYYTTYVERDVHRLINVRDIHAFQMFVRLCAGRVGQEFNASAMSNEIGVSVPTIKQWLSILCMSYVTYLLHPYHANIGKRLTKIPKIYFYDTGLATFLLGIKTVEQLDVHPLRGNLFENLVMNDFMKQGSNSCSTEHLFFYRDKGQHEVDVMRMLADGKFEAYEIKSARSFQPDFLKNLKYVHNLMPDRIIKSQVIYDGTHDNDQQTDGYVNFRRVRLQIS